MGMIDGEDYHLLFKKKDDSMLDKVVSGIDQLAMKNYPVNIVKDVDGDSYDSNESKRDAYTLGATEILLMFLSK